MPRKSAKAAAAEVIQTFFTEAKDGIMSDVMKTRQTARRAALLAQLDAFDKVEARFYAWSSSGSDVA